MLKRIGVLLLAVFVGWQIYAHALGWMYGNAKCWRSEAWWGTVEACQAKMP